MMNVVEATGIPLWACSRRSPSHHAFDHARHAGIYIRDQFGYDELRWEFQHASWNAEDNDTALVKLIGA